MAEPTRDEIDASIAREKAVYAATTFLRKHPARRFAAAEISVWTSSITNIGPAYFARKVKDFPVRWLHTAHLPEMWMDRVSQVGDGRGRSRGAFVLDCLLADRMAGGEPIFEASLVTQAQGYGVRTTKRWIVRWATIADLFLETDHASLKAAKRAVMPEKIREKVTADAVATEIDMGVIRAMAFND